MTTDPNRYAGPAEAALLRSHIIAEEDEMARVQSRLAAVGTTLHDAEQRLLAAQEETASARAILVQIQSREENLAQSLRVARGLLHPIRRLPADILSSIFETWLDETERDEKIRPVTYRAEHLPFVAGRVCRRWRHVALSTASLWTGVKLALDEAKLAPVAWLTYLESVLHRSKSLPIHVDVYASGVEDGTVTRVAAVLLVSSNRWCSLHISTSGPPSPDVRAIAGCRRTPLLETLSVYIGDEHHSSPPLSLPSYAPRLHTVDINEIFVDWNTCSRMDNVKELKYHMLLAPVNIADFALIASLMPNLERLRLLLLRGARGNSPAITFPRVTFAELNTDSVFAQTVRCPRLEHLDLTDLGTRSDISTFEAFVRNSQIQDTLRVLVVRAASLGSGFAHTLHLLKSIEEFETHNCALHDEFFAPLSGPGLGGSWSMPQLRRFHAYLKGSGHTGERMPCSADALRSMVAARRAAAAAGSANAPKAVEDVLRSGWNA
ncbi:hypothetical protein EXIGLDRAFT_829818 [Exidia glandulosa HHB12029]|uniref:Uncharacterized protein n=1 Tax=Exidia glandulosa HHB12029 TaxID=1314781 RepID=A0A165PB18_EXIGL|nr:hypothetical protein EXIGLDRAFT_829818 [Exidia glandulosa HHB12029]